MGRDLAFVCLRRHPELLDLASNEIMSRIHALDSLLRGTGAQQKTSMKSPQAMDGASGSPDLAWQVVENRGEVLTLPSEVLRDNYAELITALG